MADSAGSRQRWTAKPFALWVIFGSLVYFGIGSTAVLIPIIIATPAAATDPIVLSSVAAIAVVLVGAYTAVRGTRWGILVAFILSVVLLGLFAPLLAPVIANPADPNYWAAISGIPALALAVVFSILSLIKFPKGLSQVPYLASAKSAGGLLTLAVVGFVVGGVIVGGFASVLVAQIVASGGAGADVRIVPNAANPQTAAPFSPKAFTVPSGTTVVWFNGDTMVHTVTSDTGLFDSGNLAPGLFYSRTFPTAGTYTYHCTPHPGMTGTIVVTP